MRVLTQEQADEFDWFHGLNLGEVTTKGRVSPENWSLFPMLRYMESIDFAGLRVLDVGTMDGLISFAAAQSGAAHVDATDLYERETFSLARKALQLETVDYHPNTSIESLLDRFGRQSFDVVVMGGLLYHLLSPLRSTLIARHLLRTGGLLLLETVATDSEAAVLHFNPSQPVIDEYTTYFVPSIAAVRGMLHFSLFDVQRIGSIAPANAAYSRSTFVARAVAPADRVAETPLMERAIERGSRSTGEQIMDEFSFARLAAEATSFVQGPPKSEQGDWFQTSGFRCEFQIQP